MYIKLSRTKQAEDESIFAKGSILEILSSYKDGTHDVIAIQAKDEEGLPYPENDIECYSMKLDKTDFTEYKEAIKLEKTSGYPGGMIEDDDDDGITESLAMLYEDKDYVIDNDGLVNKKSIKKQAEENNLTPSNEDISMDFADSVDGQDDPGTTDNYKENTATKPSTELFSNPLAKKIQYKIKSLKKRLAETNNLADSADISQDDNTSVDGAGTVDKSTYKEDTKTMPWKDKNLGNVSKKK